jgi:hypothetical protein
MRGSRYLPYKKKQGVKSLRAVARIAVRRGQRVRVSTINKTDRNVNTSPITPIGSRFYILDSGYGILASISYKIPVPQVSILSLCTFGPLDLCTYVLDPPCSINPIRNSKFHFTHSQLLDNFLRAFILGSKWAF